MELLDLSLLLKKQFVKEKKVKEKKVVVQTLRQRNKGRLFEHKCGNPSCENRIEFIWDDRLSLRLALQEAKWITHKSIKGDLCPECHDIQVRRYKLKGK